MGIEMLFVVYDIKNDKTYIGTKYSITRDIFKYNLYTDEINSDIVEKHWNVLKNNPDLYTIWFKIIFDQFYHFLEEHTL
jgi:hypothetical protein